jgi:hypothetical protein
MWAFPLLPLEMSGKNDIIFIVGKEIFIGKRVENINEKKYWFFGPLGDIFT